MKNKIIKFDAGELKATSENLLSEYIAMNFFKHLLQNIIYVDRFIENCNSSQVRIILGLISIILFQPIKFAFITVILG